MNQVTLRNLDENVLHRHIQWAWQNGLPLEESLRRLLMDVAYLESFERFLSDISARAFSRAAQ